MTAEEINNWAKMEVVLEMISGRRKLIAGPLSLDETRSLAAKTLDEIATSKGIIL